MNVDIGSRCVHPVLRTGCRPWFPITRSRPRKVFLNPWGSLRSGYLVTVLQVVPPLQSHQHRTAEEVQKLTDERLTVSMEHRRDTPHNLVVQHVPRLGPALEHRGYDWSV